MACPIRALADLDRRLHNARIPFALVTLARHAALRQPACVGHDDDSRLFDMYGARDGTVNLGRTDEQVLDRWQDARTDDTAAALERALRPHASTDP
ncbi:hypothetical protein ACJ51O_04990 [Burkholderia pyrrocinia]|uniref:hypothetical protein n=1 Tax=Burkholderia TaxID=32008 RepID=UPI001C2FF659|nr:MULTISPECIES: hypothetical protein [Burkholderia]UOB56414.1 hypothetical protein MRS60_04725 [Burkholderia pyrrocinia]